MKTTFLIMILSLPVFAAPPIAPNLDKVDMSNCVAYIRSVPALAKFLPLTSEGEIDRVVQAKLIGSHQITKWDRSIENGVDTTTILGQDAENNTKIVIGQENGKLASISVSTGTKPPGANSAAGPGSPYGNPYAPRILPMPGQQTQMLSATVHSSTYGFRFQHNACVPTSAAFTDRSSVLPPGGMIANSLTTQGESFNIDTCRNLKTFFDKNKSANIATEAPLSSQLRSIMSSAPTEQTSSSFGLGGYGTPLTTVHPQIADPNALVTEAKKNLNTCNQTPGVKTAIANEALWKNAENASDEFAPGVKQ